MSRCSFNDCQHVALPCSKIAFFSLPRDWRRSIWIENSGNDALKSISDTTKRLFCEKHFDEKYFKKQFNRTTLLKSAIPFKYLDDKQNSSKTTVVSLVTSSSNDNELTEVIEDEYLIQENIESDNNEFCLNGNEINDSTIYEIKNDDQINKTINDNDDETTDDTDVDIEIPATSTTLKETNKRKINNKNLVENANVFNKKRRLIVKCDVTKHEQEQQQQHHSDQKSYNEDEHFALSLVGQLQRLPNGKKAIAKVSILNYLLQLELGSIQPDLFKMY